MNCVASFDRFTLRALPIRREQRPSLAMTAQARIKCFNQHRLYARKFALDRWCYGCAMPLYDVDGWLCLVNGARFARALRALGLLSPRTRT